MADLKYWEKIPARPTTYKGVPMRSRLEARFARWIDGIPGITWEYEPRAFADGQGEYLPDFVTYGWSIARMDSYVLGSRSPILGGTWKQPVVFEVKPPVAVQTTEDEQREFERMEVVRASSPYAALALWFADGWFLADFGRGSSPTDVRRCPECGRVCLTISYLVYPGEAVCPSHPTVDLGAC